METARIRFEADDSGFEDTLSRMRSRAHTVFNDIANDAALNSPSDPLGGSRQNVTAFSRSAEIDYRARMMDLEERRRSITADTKLADGTKETLLGQVKAQEEALRQELEENRIQSSLLKDILEAIRSGSREEYLANQDAVEARVRAHQEGTYIPENGRELLTLEEQARLIKKNAEGTPEERERTWVQVMKGMLAYKAIDYTLGAVGHGLSVLATSQYGEQGVAQLMSGIPWVGSGISSAYQRHLDASLEREIQSNQLRRIGFYDASVS